MRSLLRVLERAAVGEVVIPVARNLWQLISSDTPATAARRRILRQASGWVIGLSDKALPVVPSCGTKQPAFAVLDDADALASAWWHGILCCLPPFSWSRIVHPAPRERRSSTFIFKAAVIRAKL
jgi:hypothetical protein